MDLLIMIIIFFGIIQAVAKSAKTGTAPGRTSPRRQNIQRRAGAQNGRTGFVNSGQNASRRRVADTFRPGKKTVLNRESAHSHKVFTSLTKRGQFMQKVYSRRANASFFNSDYDDYSRVSAKAPGTDYISGYDRNYSPGSAGFRESARMQYSHTYDGHEPWDDCLPKEKDPWDKDFYINK